MTAETKDGIKRVVNYS